MKRFHTLLVVLGAGFLVYLVGRIGWWELWRELRSLGWGLLPLLLCEGGAEFIHTLGWRHCLSRPSRALSLMQLFRIRMAGYALNYLTPTATLSGEATKAALLTAHGPGAEAVSGVLIGKVCFALAHLLFVLLGSVAVLWRFRLAPTLWASMLGSTALVATGILGFLLLQKYGKLGGILRWLAARRIGGRRLRAAAHGLTEVDEAMKAFYHTRPREVLWALGWHLVGDSVGIVQAWWFLSLLSPGASLATAASTWFLGMWFDLLTFAVPMNLGTLEGTRIIALRAGGYSALVGMTYGLMLRLAQLLWAGLGLLGYGWEASRRAGAPAASPGEGHEQALDERSPTVPAGPAPIKPSPRSGWAP